MGSTMLCKDTKQPTSYPRVPSAGSGSAWQPRAVSDVAVVEGAGVCAAVVGVDMFGVGCGAAMGQSCCVCLTHQVLLSERAMQERKEKDQVEKQALRTCSAPLATRVPQHWEERMHESVKRV